MSSVEKYYEIRVGEYTFERTYQTLEAAQDGLNFLLEDTTYNPEIWYVENVKTDRKVYPE